MLIKLKIHIIIALRLVVKEIGLIEITGSSGASVLSVRGE